MLDCWKVFSRYSPQATRAFLPSVLGPQKDFEGNKWHPCAEFPRLPLQTLNWPQKAIFKAKQGSLHFAPEHCLVNGGFPCIWWKKQCFKSATLFRSPAKGENIMGFALGESRAPLSFTRDARVNECAYHQDTALRMGKRRIPQGKRQKLRSAWIKKIWSTQNHVKY